MEVSPGFQLTVVPIPVVCGGPPPGQDPARFQTPGGIVTASPAVFDGTLYLAGGKTVYALKTSDGTLLWKTVICGRPEETDCASDANDPTQVLSSPALFDGKLFFGTATGGVNFGIPYRGGFVALDAESGKLVWRFEVDRRLEPNGRIDGVLNRGCDRAARRRCVVVSGNRSETSMGILRHSRLRRAASAAVSRKCPCARYGDRAPAMGISSAGERPVPMRF